MPTRSNAISGASTAGPWPPCSFFGDIDIAEEAVQEAFAVALDRWPVTGLPPNPGAWITITARNRAIDHLRREASRHDRYAQAALLYEREEGQALVRGCLRRDQPGPYQIQAAINAVHTDAPTAAATDWRQILQLEQRQRAAATR